MLNSKAVCRFHLKNVCNGEFPSQVNLMTGVVPMFASAILGIANGANIMIITHAERVVAVWASPGWRRWPCLLHDHGPDSSKAFVWSLISFQHANTYTQQSSRRYCNNFKYLSEIINLTNSRCRHHANVTHEEKHNYNIKGSVRAAYSHAGYNNFISTPKITIRF